MILREAYTVTIACDDNGHAVGDTTGTETFAAGTRREVFEDARRQGWEVDTKTGEVRCPRHSRAPASRSLAAVGSGADEALRALLTRSARERINLLSAGDAAGAARVAGAAAQALGESLSAARIGGIARRIDRVSGQPDAIAALDAPFDSLVGRVLFFPLDRSWDRIKPPGAGIGLPYGSAHDIMLDRRGAGPKSSDYGRRSWRAALRPAIVTTLDAARAGDAARAWIANRSIEWHITDPDVWAAMFVGKGGDPWWECDGEQGAAMRGYIALAIYAMLVPLLDLAPWERCR